MTPETSGLFRAWLLAIENALAREALPEEPPDTRWLWEELRLERP